MKIVPIRKKSSITPIALTSLRHKACVICSDDDYVPIHNLDEAYEHAWDHWDAWRIIREMVPGQLEIPLIWQKFLRGLSEAVRQTLEGYQEASGWMAKEGGVDFISCAECGEEIQNLDAASRWILSRLRKAR